MERLKASAYLQRIAETHFWRTYDGQEIDMIEERNGRLLAYEVKWSERAQLRIPPSWKSTYPNAKAKLLNREIFLSCIFEGATSFGA